MPASVRWSALLGLRVRGESFDDWLPVVLVLLHVSDLGMMAKISVLPDVPPFVVGNDRRPGNDIDIGRDAGLIVAEIDKAKNELR